MREVAERNLRRANDAYATELSLVADELRSTCEMIEAIAEDDTRVLELRRSRDWREDEIKFLSQLVADVRMRIGAY
tara:strand:- start:2027 stop:2254 length:228 start_codon:yes stop_codon:yes gene_type:complete